jgi:glucose/arabinose dehydrogenase
MKLPLRLILSIILSNLLVIFCTNQSLAQPYVTQGDVPAERGFRRVTLVEGLEHPWSMAWLPNSDILITERPRRLRLVRDDRLIPDPVSGVPEMFASGQGGLLDVSLPPRFNQNRKVYFTYAHGTAKANRTRVASAVLNNDALDNLQVIFEVATVKPGSQHFGSRLI